MTADDGKVPNRPLRFLDTHVHFWDPARPEWYPQLAPDVDFSAIGLGTAAGMKRRYDPGTYRADAASLHIDGVVHVTATRGSGAYLAETAAMAHLHDSDGLPTALVGGFDPESAIGVIERELDEQATLPIVTGVRTMETIDYTAPKAALILEAIARRGLVFDVVTHPAQMRDVANRLDAHPEATYVIEHTGWPLTTTDAERRQWRDGMRALADCGPHVYCKLSGLAMTLHTFDIAAMRAWLEPAIEIFGAHRCMFGSNFPVDAMFGSLPSLIRTYDAITAPLGDDVQHLLFNENARRVYCRGG